MTTQICGVQTKVFDDPRIFDVITGLRDGQEDREKFDRLEVVPRHDYFVLQKAPGADVAVMNTHVSSCLRNLRKDASIRYEGLMDIVEWQETMQAWKKTGKAGNLTVDINVYGPLEDFEKVGRALSKARLYLQHPHHSTEGALYKNPHYLTFSNAPNLNLDVPTVAVSSTQGVPSVPQYSVSYALEDLHQREYLRQIEVDQRIRTPLLK